MELQEHDGMANVTLAELLLGFAQAAEEIRKALDNRQGGSYTLDIAKRKGEKEND